MASVGNTKEENLAAAVKAMEELVEEAVQVYELDKEESIVIDDLYNSLKIITSFLGFSVDLHPSLLDLPESTRAVLTPSLDILIVKPNFKSETKRFDQLNLDETSNILRFAIPTITTMAKTDRTIKNKKMALLRESTKKLKHLPTSNAEDMVINDTTVHMEKVEKVES